MSRRIYLDAHATTPADPEVVAAMLPFMNGIFANPSSTQHAGGRDAAAAVAMARSQVADLIGASPEEIVFTSGATESNNLAIHGSVPGWGSHPGQVVTAATEHSAVLDPVHALARYGHRVDVLPVSRDGMLRPEELAGVLQENILMTSVMAANNEVGTLQPVAALAAVAHDAGAIVHCDAAQAVGHIPVDTGTLGVDLLSFSAHKFYGPKGVGALYVRGGMAGSALRPLVYGGGHEDGLRAGTLNVPAIIGMGLACKLAARRMHEDAQRLSRLRDALQETLLEQVEGATVNGAATARLPHNLNITLPGVDAGRLAASLQNVEVTTGAACAAGAGRPSHVLSALGLSPAAAASTLRFGLTRHCSQRDIQEAAAEVTAAWRRLRES